jgi:hypothetical protein
MIRLNSVRATRLALYAAALGLSLQANGGLASGVHAARLDLSAGRISSAAGRPMTGKVQSSTRNLLALMQPGSKKVTLVQLNARTQYIAKGKRLAKQPAFARGSSIRVVTSKSKGVFIARIVIVGSSATPAAGAVTAPPPNVPTVVAPETISLAGAVTLASAATVTLQTATGTQTIKLTAATRYIVNGKASPFKPVLHAGEKVRIAVVQSRGVLLGRIFTVG